MYMCGVYIGGKKMQEVEIDKKEMEKKRNKYYLISFWIRPELDEKLDDLLHHYVREYLKEFLNEDEKELLFITRSEINKFFNRYINKRIYTDKNLHDKWKALPLGIKKRLYYLVNKKLMEVFINESQTHATKY